MGFRRILAGLLAGFFLYSGGTALAALPPDAPKDIKYILGFYYGNGENVIIRENRGDLELLFRTLKEDISFAKANVFPLKKERYDSYTMREAGPLMSQENSVRFERNQDGYGVTCKVGGHRYSRMFLGSGTGENAKPFRLKPPEDWMKLREEAKNASMPQALASGSTAKLVDLAGYKGIKLDPVYAGSSNCFGVPLCMSEKMYLGSSAADALAKAHKDLARHGFGIMVWEAYRPWSVSKLAYLALPEERKSLLEDPDKKGSPHNTGNAVDVTLYSLETGEPLEMISGFDEPSPRQFAHYAGGTTRQRYLRDMLRDAMEMNGFRSIEDEWWHFEYGVGSYAHLNYPLEIL
ncbi:MAG: peptidase [Phascolarctobacterium sp.]|nr:peptidase [Phascolarctobacterium sp.]